MAKGTPDWSRQWFGYYGYIQEGFLAGWTVFEAVGLGGYLQLLNPVGSNVVVFVTNIRGKMTTPGTIQLRHYDTPLGTNIVLTASNCKYVGRTAPSAELRAEQSAASLGVTMFAYYDSIELDLTFEPIILDPGKGIVVVGCVVNTRLDAGYEWLEL